MSTRDIYIPQSMIDLLQNPFRKDFRRKDAIESLVLMYSIMDGWNIKTKPDSFGRRWKEIHDRHFVGVTENRNMRAKIRKWLVENGFIEIRQVRCKDGQQRNLRVKTKTSQQYRIKSKKKWTTYAVDVEAYFKANAVTETGPDWASKATRANLSLLTRTDQLVKEKNNRTNRAIWTLENNSGTVKKGKKVDRLFSPWCFASEEVRGLFLLDGEPLVSFDLGSAQPSIAAKLAGDDDLLAACKEDKLYPAIGNLLGLSREDAKPAFYIWCYGPTLHEEPVFERTQLRRRRRSKKTTKTKARKKKQLTSDQIADLAQKKDKAFKTKQQTWEVEKYMVATYPRTAAYAERSKQPKYFEFSRRMQDLEAEIFIEGIFAELVQLGIPALTCHDGIYCPIIHGDQVEQICRKHLTLFFGNHFVLNPSNHQSLVDSVCIS